MAKFDLIVTWVECESVSIEEDGRAWPKVDHKRTYRLTATHLMPIKAAIKRMGW